MFRTVVAFESESAVNSVSEILEKAGITVRYRCRTVSAALRAINTMGGGVVICGFRFPDGTADSLAEDLGNKALCLVAAKQIHLDMLESRDIFRISLPLRGFQLVGSVNMLIQMDQKLQMATIPQRSPDETEYINRAKELLMAKHGYSEPEAHRYLQKLSMDRSVKLTEMARYIITALEE